MPDERLIYSSENGDRWVLIQELGSGRAIVRHTANLSSGGQITDTEVGEFLSRGRGSPEHVALRRMLLIRPERS
jgi:hypothetical protein